MTENGFYVIYAPDGARSEIQAIIGSDLAGVRPGSAEAARVKDVLVERGMWSQYLEVGIGPSTTNERPSSRVISTRSSGIACVRPTRQSGVLTFGGDELCGVISWTLRAGREQDTSEGTS